MEFLQLFTDRTVTTLKSSALVPYPVIPFLHVFVRRRQRLIRNVDTLHIFIPACCREALLEREENSEIEEMFAYDFTTFVMILLDSVVHATDSVEMKQCIGVLHRSVKVVV